MLTSTDLTQLGWLLSCADKNFFQAREKVRHLFQGSRAIKDPVVESYVLDQIIKFSENNYHNKLFLKDFENNFLFWLKQHTTNTVVGLESFVSNFSNGTTQAFDSFYLRYSNKRFVCFVGEYFYHIKSWLSLNTKWAFIRSVEDIQPNDAVIISSPFCDTGQLHREYSQLIDRCNKLNVPLLVDCCYFTISGHINLNFDHPCIDTVCFSLSKAFPVANYRIGVRYTRKEIFDGQSLLSSIDYNNNFGAYLGLQIINQFGSDYIYNKYQEKQKHICANLSGLTKTNCAIFALGDSTWNQYSRKNLLKQYQLSYDSNMFTNRICLNSIFENWDLYQEYENTIKI